MDNVSDALIRIKNGYLSQRGEVVLPYSKLVIAICAVLEKEGYITSTEEIKGGRRGNIPQLKAVLKYESKKAAMSGVKRISKPGLRVYKGSTALPWVLNGLGIAIISTPKGVMTDKQARKESVGGEVLAYVW
jgi:small subunit ribosomal protein S8